MVCSTTDSTRMYTILRKTTRGVHRGPRWNPPRINITGTEEDVQAFVKFALCDSLATFAKPIGGHSSRNKVKCYQCIECYVCIESVS